MKKTFFILGILTFGSIAFFSFKSINSADENNYVDVVDGDLDPLWEGYRDWFHVTKDKPNTGDPTGFLSGKHKGTKAFREIYINKSGEAVHKQAGNPKYPAGTVIVKESYGSKAKWEAKSGPQLTIMVKLKEGESPETSDWGYVMGAKGKVSTGTSKWAKFCNKCHIYGAANDNTFMTSDFIKNNQ